MKFFILSIKGCKKFSELEQGVFYKIKDGSYYQVSKFNFKGII